VNVTADQADGLRRLLNASACRVIAVAGLSRGVGATLTAMNLSVELARQGKQVVLLDEHGCTAQSACAGWSIGPRGTLDDVACGRLDFASAAATAGCGVRVLPAPAGLSRGSFNPRTLCPRGVIVVDVALDDSGQLSPLARIADELIIVMQPVASSITATYAGLKRVQYTHALQQFQFLVNNVASAAQAERVIANVTNASRRYLAVSLRPLGWISSDPLVCKARSSHQTVCEAYPTSPAAMEFRRIAAAVRERISLFGAAPGVPAGMPANPPARATTVV
jgi:flagellar biosynthesis protein FlhG